MQKVLGLCAMKNGPNGHERNGQIWKRRFIVEEARFLAKNVTGWKINGQKRVHRSVLPGEDGNQLRKKAMREDILLSSWLREDVEKAKAEMEMLKEEAKQEESKRKLEGESGRVEEKESVGSICVAKFSRTAVPLLRWRVCLMCLFLCLM